MNDPSDSPFRLLFVCTGNTCRSPMAEAIARRLLAELGWDRVEVRSAGVAAFDGSPASGGAVRVTAAHGLNLSDHSATLLTEEETTAADLVLTMSHSHLIRVMELGGGDRAALLTAYARGPEQADTAWSIPDPVGGPDEEYEETFRLLEELVAGVMSRLEPVLTP
jgi:protein-tyrosine-phosphatase